MPPRHDLRQFRRLWWRSDLLTYGLAAWTTSLVIAGAALAGVELAWSSAAIAAGMWALWFGKVGLRAHLRRRISFVTRHGVAVVTHGLSVYPPPLEAYLDWFIQLWEHETQWPVAQALDGVLIVWKPAPWELHRTLGWVARQGWPTDRTVVVGYHNDLIRSALGHELGHVVMRAWCKQGSETALRSYALDHGLPY